MRLTTVQLGLLVLGSGLALLWHVASFPTMAGMQFGPAFFPRLIGWGFTLCGAGLLLGATLDAPARPPRADRASVPAALRFVGVLVAIAGFAVVAPAGGFLVAAAAATAAVALIFGARLFPTAVMVVVLPVALWLMFERVFRVTLPRGALEAWLTGGT